MMEELWVGIIGATLTLSILTGLTVRWARETVFDEFLSTRYQKLAANMSAILFGLSWAYVGAFILGELGAPELVASAGAQGVIAGLAATFGYETLKNGMQAVRGSGL
jgi:hypothetical protein